MRYVKQAQTLNSEVKCDPIRLHFPIQSLEYTYRPLSGQVDGVLALCSLLPVVPCCIISPNPTARLAFAHTFFSSLSFLSLAHSLQVALSVLKARLLTRTRPGGI